MKSTGGTSRDVTRAVVENQAKTGYMYPFLGVRGSRWSEDRLGKARYH